jgi:ribosomal protein L16 Arg81 hydroxylase
VRAAGSRSRSPLARILFPLSASEFVERYFQRHALKISGTRQKFDFLFRPGDLETNLERVPDILAYFPDRQAKIDPAEIQDMVRSGATVCLIGLESAHANLANAANRIKSELHYSGEVAFRAYLSAPSRGIFDVHYDARVATTLQIAGQKRWWYATTPAVPFPLSNSGRSSQRRHSRHRPPTRASLRSVLLRPGDLLCLPAGTWHCARAQTMSLALSLTFGHHRTGVFDSIAAALRQRLERDPAWRAPLPATTRTPPRDRVPADVAAILGERIDLLQRELTRMRQSTAALRRVWRMPIGE